MIWDDVGFYDNIDMKMMLLLMIILIKNDVIGNIIDLRMMLLLMIILKWDDIDVGNVIEMRWCWWW